MVVNDTMNQVPNGIAGHAGGTNDMLYGATFCKELASKWISRTFTAIRMISRREMICILIPSIILLFAFNYQYFPITMLFWNIKRK